MTGLVLRSCRLVDAQSRRAMLPFAGSSGPASHMICNPRAADGSTSTDSPCSALPRKFFNIAILLFVLAEPVIYIPLITCFQLHWLQYRLAAARTAVLINAAAPSGMVPDDLMPRILHSIDDAKAIAIKTHRTRRLLAVSAHLPAVTYNFDLRNISVIRATIASFDILLFGKSGLMRVVGPAPMGGDSLEIVVEVRRLRKAMLQLSLRFLLLSSLLSTIVAVLIYFVWQQNEAK
jgi:hypothetical protein